MRERLRRDVAGRHLLQAVVADSGGGAEAGVDVALIDDVALLGGVRPDAGETIGLEFESDRKRIAFRRITLLEAADLPLDAEQLLHVMTDLVREDVGLRELAGRAETCAQLVVKSEIDIYLLIGRAVERTCCGLRFAAAGLSVVAE